MKHQASPHQKIDYRTSVRIGRFITFGEQQAFIYKALLHPAKKALPVKTPTVQQVEPINKGKALFNAMKLFFDLKIHVDYEQVDNKRYIKAVVWDNEKFPVNFSKTMNRVVIFDAANKKSLTVEQFVAMTGKTLKTK